MSGGLDEAIGCSNEEEIRSKNLLGLGEFLLRLLEVKIEVKGLDEVGHRVVVLVVFLLDNSDDVLELLLVLSGVACTAAVGDNCCSEVSENPGACGLDGIDEGRREEDITDCVSCRLVVEEGEESPVNEPCAVSKLCERIGEEFGIDGFLHLLHFLHSRLPVCGEDFRGELSPCGGRDFVVVGGEHSELVEEFRGRSVVSTAVLEVSEVVENVDHLDGDLDQY